MAARHAWAGIASIASLTVSSAGNPMEYSSPASVMWCRNAFEQAPVSARTSTRAWSASGSWSIAATRVLMWSALACGDAVPGRKSSASGSPVPCSPWSTNAHIGANPKVRLNVGPACSLSECAVTSVESKSTTTWPPSPLPGRPASGRRRAHTAARARARAARIAGNEVSTSAANVAISRETVGSEATDPNNSG